MSPSLKEIMYLGMEIILNAEISRNDVPLIGFRYAFLL